MRKSWHKALSAILSVSLCFSLLSGAALAAEETPDPYSGDVVLFLANDMHSNFGPSKIMEEDGSTTVIGGVARMAAALAEERALAEGKYLTLNGGDYSMGTPYQDGYQKGWEIMVLGALGFDYATLGNHEFDVGDQAIENSWVSARANAAELGVDDPMPALVVSNMFVKYDEAGNVIEYTEADIDPEDITTNAFGYGEYAETGAVNYAIAEVNGYKVGLFALVGDNAYGYCKNSDLTRMDNAATANIYSKYLKEEQGCDLVIAISHCGDAEDKAIAEASEGYLDIIQSAHSHTVYDEPINVNGVVIYSTGSNAQNLGILSLDKTADGWAVVADESQTLTLTDAYDYDDPTDTSAPAQAYRKLSALVAQYDEALVAPDGYFSKLGLEGVTSNTVVMNVENGHNYVQVYDGKAYGYTYIQSPVTAFIGDAFNYASGSQVSFFFGGYVRTALYEGEFTVADAFNMQSTGESAVDRSAGSSLIVCNLSGKQLAGICYFDAMCSGAVGDILYGGAGTLHSSGMRYKFDVSGKTISCDTDTIEIYDAATDTWSPLDPDKAYLCSFTFESSQNLVGYMPMLTGLLGYGAIPFAPYDEATGTYAQVPADNTSDEYYAFWAPYCQGVGVLEGTDLELKAWTALYYYADSMNGTLSDYYTPANLDQTRYRETYTVDGTADAGAAVTLTVDGEVYAQQTPADGKYAFEVPNGKYVLTTTVDGVTTSRTVNLSMNTVTAQASACTANVGGKVVDIAAYDIDGTTYVKLRDVAAVVSGTPAAFDLAWDAAAGEISVISGQNYTPVGGENVAASGTAKYINPSSASIQLDGSKISISLYNIGGNNYCPVSALSSLGVVVLMPEA